MHAPGHMVRKPLQQAALFGFTDIAKMLLDAGADVNSADPTGGRALLNAAGNGHIDVCKLLLDAGARVDAANDDGATALHFAAGYGRLDICQLLLAAGADLHALDAKHRTPLHYAGGYAEVVTELVAAGATLVDGHGCAAPCRVNRDALARGAALRAAAAARRADAALAALVLHAGRRDGTPPNVAVGILAALR